MMKEIYKNKKERRGKKERNYKLGVTTIANEEKREKAKQIWMSFLSLDRRRL